MVNHSHGDYVGPGNIRHGGGGAVPLVSGIMKQLICVTDSLFIVNYW